MVIKQGIMGMVDDDPNTPEAIFLKRFNNLAKQITNLDIFEHEGRYYYGSYVSAIKSFIENNPQPADFGVWLQRNWTAFTEFKI